LGKVSQEVWLAKKKKLCEFYRPGWMERLNVQLPQLSIFFETLSAVVLSRCKPKIPQQHVFGKLQNSSILFFCRIIYFWS